VSYASDLALTASSRNSAEQQSVARVRILKGVMTQEREVRETKTYTVRNEDDAARMVIIEHPARPGYELRTGIQPAEITSGWMRFRLPVEPKQTATLTVEEVRPLQSTLSVASISSEQLAVFASQKIISAAIESALRSILEQRNANAELESKAEELSEERDRIYDDQQRLRENLKALRGTPDEKTLVQRYTRQLDQQENRLEALQKEQTRLAGEIAAMQARVQRAIEDLAFDERL
jgi:hypothetical protein